MWFLGLSHPSEAMSTCSKGFAANLYLFGALPGVCRIACLVYVYHVSPGKLGARWHVTKCYSFFFSCLFFLFFFQSRISEYHPGAVQDDFYPGSLVNQNYCSLVIVAFWVSVWY